MAGIYRPRHPERTVLYRVLFHYFARIRCPDSHAEHLLTFSCRTRYFGFYANAHRGKIKKASLDVFPLRMVEELRPIPSRGWAEIIRKVYEVDPMVFPRCGGKMRVIAFLTDYSVVDRIIDHLKLTFVADKPPPAHLAYQDVLMAAEAGGEYFS